MSIIHNTSVDFTRRVISEPVHIVQGDKTLPQIEVELLADGQPYTIPSGASVAIRYGKPDGNAIVNNAASTSGNTATFTVTEQMSALPGEMSPQVMVTVSGGVAATGSFPLIIDKNSVEGAKDSESELSAFDKAIQAVATVNKSVEKAALSEKNAAASEKAAKTSETNAANSAKAASASQTAAAASEKNAKASELAASESKADAAISETNAAASAKVITDNKANIDAVAENVEALNTVSENIQTVKDINDNVEAVKTVSEKISDVTTVSENMENIGTVKDNIVDVNTVAGAVTDVQTVSASIADVNTAAAHATDLENITANLEDIQNADDNAAQAKTQRDESEKFAQESEAWARGSIDGKDLADGEGEQYQNNSKYYSEQAAASKAQAAEYEAGAQNYYEQVKTYAGTVVPQLLLDPDTGRLYMSPDGKNINFALLEGHLYYQLTASA